jgi:hypothetical protein
MKKQYLMFLLVGLHLATIFYLTSLPLLNQFHYEFCLLTSLLATLLWIPSLLIFELHIDTLENRRGGFTEIIIFFVLLCSSVAISLTRSIWSGSCSLIEGLRFFCLLTLPSTRFSLLQFLKSIFRQRKWIALAYFSIILCSFLGSLFRFFRDPPIFFMNHFMGYIHGPFYDHEIPITHELIDFRTVTVGISICLSAITLMFRYAKIPEKFGALPILGGAIIGAIIFTDAALPIKSSRKNIEEALGGKLKTPHFTLIYDRSLSREYIQNLAEAHEFRYAQISAELGLKTNRTYTSMIYLSNRQKKKMMGAGETQFADVLKGIVHLAHPHPLSPILKHELVHLLASEFGNPWFHGSVSIGLMEGLAVWSDSKDQVLKPHQWAQTIFDSGFNFPIARLFHLMQFWNSRPVHAYKIAGSFVSFLIDFYGLEKFKILYAGLDNFPHLYGLTLAQMEIKWRIFLKTVPSKLEDQRRMKPAILMKGIAEMKCPHTSARKVNKAEQALANSQLEKPCWNNIYERAQTPIDVHSS